MPQMLNEYVALFKEFKDVNVWSYKDMKDISSELCHTKSTLEDNAKHVC